MSSIFERRSVRSFLPQPVPRDSLERILKAGFEAPSAHNRRPWEFILHTAKADLEAIAGMSPYAKMAPGAAAAVTACAGFKAPPEPGDCWWVQDLSASVENILLQIVEEGLGGVWLGWYPDQDRVRAFSERFGLPPQVIPFAVILLGYPAQNPSQKDRWDPKKVYLGKYGVPWI